MRKITIILALLTLLTATQAMGKIDLMATENKTVYFTVEKGVPFSSFSTPDSNQFAVMVDSPSQINITAYGEVANYLTYEKIKTLNKDEWTKIEIKANIPLNYEGNNTINGGISATLKNNETCNGCQKLETAVIKYVQINVIEPQSSEPIKQSSPETSKFLMYGGITLGLACIIGLVWCVLV